MSGDGPEVLIDEREVIDGEYVKRIRVLAVPESEKFPEGIKYRMHYGTVDGETILRYDNSHGTHERHHPNGVEEIEFPGYEVLYRRFTGEVESRGLLNDHHVSHQWQPHSTSGSNRARNSTSELPGNSKRSTTARSEGSTASRC